MGLGFRVRGLGFRVRFRVKGCKVQGSVLGFRIWGFISDVGICLEITDLFANLGIYWDLRICLGSGALFCCLGIGLGFKVLFGI